MIVKSNHFKPSLRYLLLTLPVFLLPGSGFCQAELSPSSITKVVTGDLRLEKKVTLFAPRAYVGEVLEKWSKESGITLTADEQDGAADQTVCILIKDVPLKDAMQALYSLLSYRGAEWIWERQGEKGAYQYTLHQSKAARELPALMAKNIQSDYENLAAKLIQAAHQSPEAKSTSDQNPVAAKLLSDPPTRRGILAFADSLSPEQQQQALRGGKPLILPIESVSPGGKMLATDYITRKRGLNPTRFFPDITQLQFHTINSGIVPSLFIGVGSGDGGFEGYEYIGSQPFEDKWNAQIGAQWLLPEDQAVISTEKETIKPPSPTDKSAVNEWMTQVAERDSHPAGEGLFIGSQVKETRQAARLWQLAEAASIPIMARLPKNVPMRTNPTDPGQPYGAVLEKYLQRASDRYLQHKWRDGVLLVASHQRLVDGTDSKTESWALVRQLRTFTDESSDGTLTLPQIASLAQQFTQEQIISVYRVGGYQVGIASGTLYDFFHLLGNKPALINPLLSRNGSTDPQIMRVLNPLLLIDRPAPQQQRVVAMRVNETQEVIPARINGNPYTVPVKRIHLQALAGDGTVVLDVPIDQKRSLPVAVAP